MTVPNFAVCTPADRAKRTWIAPGYKWVDRQPKDTLGHCGGCDTPVWVSPEKVAAVQSGTAVLRCWPCVRPDWDREIRGPGVAVVALDSGTRTHHCRRHP